MALFTPRPDRSIVEALAKHIGRRIEVLAQASGPGIDALATRELLALHRDGAWQTWGWEEIAGGGWRAADRLLHWRTTDGDAFEVQLESVGRLPELFRERVEASTVASETHDLAPGRVQIIGRRKLDGSGETRWFAVAGGGADLTDPATAAYVVEQTDRLKVEFE